MIARLSFIRTLALAGIVTALAMPLSAGSAFAATNPHHTPAPTQSAPMHNTGHHPSPPMHSAGHHPSGSMHSAGHHDRVSTLRTRTRDAQIRMSPTAERHGRTVSTLRMPGSKVVVTCSTDGARVKGSSIWYQTVAPARGYISSSDVARPMHPIGRCK